MKGMSLSPLSAPLEKDKESVKVGSKVVYSDMANYMKYTVTAVDSEKFSAEEIDGSGVIEDSYFENLQYGWELTKEEIV